MNVEQWSLISTSILPGPDVESLNVLAHMCLGDVCEILSQGERLVALVVASIK